jgi:hypothetical protein
MEKHLATGAEQPADGWYGISVAQALAAKRKAEWSGKSCVPSRCWIRQGLSRADSALALRIAATGQPEMTSMRFRR